MSSRVMITGASGLLGRSIYSSFKAASCWEVLGLAFSRATEHLIAIDLTDSTAVHKVIKEFEPQVIIHCAAERKADVVEKQEEVTRRINVDATRSVCEAAESVGAWVLFISTDYVFDGTSPPYSIKATPNPMNKYGQSKLEGETITLHVNATNCVLRVPILYGNVHSLGESAVTLLFEKVKKTDEECLMDNYQRRYPTHTADVAAVVRQLSDRHLLDKSIQGIYHWSGDELMTKYKIAVLMAELFDLPSEHIVPNNSPPEGTPRPYDCCLDTSCITELGFGQRTPFKSGIKSVLVTYYP